MFESKVYTGELHFLNKIVGDRNLQYKSADWLTTPFDSNVWLCDFSGQPALTINFNVQLPDNRLLTDPRHRELLLTFKMWLCLQTHFDATGGKLTAPRSARIRVRSAIHIIDYMLLNAEKLNICHHGLSILTTNDLRGILLDFASSNAIQNSIYRWPEKLRSFLITNINQCEPRSFENSLNRFPHLYDLPSTEDWILDMNEDEVVRSRVWLWENGFYYDNTWNTSDYRYTPNTVALSAEIYKNTLGGFFRKKTAVELCAIPIDVFHRECIAIPVKDLTVSGGSQSRFNYYNTTLRNIGLLAEIKPTLVPLQALQNLNINLVKETLDLKPGGRFRTLPVEVVFFALKSAVEFFLEYSDDIISCYLAVIRDEKINSINEIASSEIYFNPTWITPKLVELGIKRWCMPRPNIRNGRGFSNSISYFNELRKNPGLWEALRILYASVQIAVGTLMARRDAELQDLVAGKCLDSTGTKMIFKNRKSGALAMRQDESRPIPGIASKMIRKLEGLQKELIQIGVQKKYVSLFSHPSRSALSLIDCASHGSLSQSLDYFCDYFEIQKNTEGHRYYIRQHQLRRFFAMLFFWNNSYSGLDSLRWFLGHTDVEHLYHYVTESTPGEVLRSVKAQYGAQLVREESGEALALASLLNEKFRTSAFNVLDSEELDQYIEELLIEGALSIEPIFFEEGSTKKYRIAIEVSGVKKHDDIK